MALIISLEGDRDDQNVSYAVTIRQRSEANTLQTSPRQLVSAAPEVVDARSDPARFALCARDFSRPAERNYCSQTVA